LKVLADAIAHDMDMNIAATSDAPNTSAAGAPRLPLRYQDKVERIANNQQAVLTIPLHTLMMSRWVRTEFNFLNMALRLLARTGRDERFRQRSVNATRLLLEFEALTRDWEARCKVAVAADANMYTPPPVTDARVVLLTQKSTRLITACARADFVLFATSILVIRNRMKPEVRDAAQRAIEDMLSELKRAATQPGQVDAANVAADERESIATPAVV